MALNRIDALFDAWNAQISASTSDFRKQVTATRRRNGVNVVAQNRLTKNGVNKKIMLGNRFEPCFVQPRGKAWIRVAELSWL
ncbi:hypothetical protein [Photobacterium kishitanii]|uniref:Uncharacterized protein n=1 Tax=Photobacterium kishitanii TaxID=318456 RepID=A0A2T3KL06_9GAMM|nr:hypothetical protein [Photobacterium kishitanii]PSV00327.1 hypothetical protein C9J27_04165 [Photobacterium kishitanii]